MYFNILSISLFTHSPAPRPKKASTARIIVSAAFLLSFLVLGTDFNADFQERICARRAETAAITAILFAILSLIKIGIRSGFY